MSRNEAFMAELRAQKAAEIAQSAEEERKMRAKMTDTELAEYEAKEKVRLRPSWPRARTL